ncbi:MAG: SBBP repeat-containing protein [Raineya sp.]|nr:SBBP repeat-containing protein [Raineya sp.]
MQRSYLFFFISCFLIFVAHTVKAQIFGWAKGMGGTSHEQGRNIAVDASNNVYTIGYFEGTVDFDPGVGTFSLISAGNRDIFISKLDVNGNLVWAKNIGGADDDYGYGIALDASGNVYITGSFTGTVDFDPNTGIFNLTSTNYQDIFVSKLDVNGNLVWAKKMGGGSVDVGNDIILDATGNIYTTGYFGGTADFDPNIGTFNLTSAGVDDIFVSKLDVNGNLVWAKSMGGTMYDDGNSITIDASGNVYITGYFFGTVDFDPNAGTFNLTSAGNLDIFVSKLDVNGNFVWAKRMGGGEPNGDYGNSITVDASGNVYTTGIFNGTADFDPGAGTHNLTSAGGDDIFVSKLDINGNFVWAKRMGGGATDYGNSITLDTFGNVYTTGQFFGTVDFDPNASTFNLTSAGIHDIFVSKLDANGNLAWVKAIGGTVNDVGHGITVDASGNVYTTGYFTSTVDFDPGSGIFNLISAGNIDIFVSKITQCSIIVINPAVGTLPSGIVGTVYSQNVSQTGLTGSPNWSISVGTLPTGLAINPISGVISGIPTTIGTFNFTIRVTDGTCSQIQGYSISVACPTLAFTNTTASNGAVGAPFSLNASVTGNTTTVTYSVAPTLPSGLSLNTSTGQITGTPTNITPSTTYTVTATQSTCSVSQAYTFSVSCPTITFTNTTANVATVGTPYTLNASATTNSSMLNYSISPTLPAGLYLNTNTGIIAGIPTSITPSTTYTVTATQSTCSVSQAYTFAVNPISLQTLGWAKNMGGGNHESGFSIAVDASGNVYTTGYFEISADFDPGVGIFPLSSILGSNDIFVSKLDASGNFIWAKKMGGSNDDTGYGIAVDASGNVYTTGYFQGTADFDPGAGTFNLTSSYDSDIFVSKLDANGNFVWAKRIGGGHTDGGNGIAVDAIGNVYTTGHFYGTVDFDPGAGTFNLTSAGGGLDRDIFVSKLDANGNFVWAKRMGGVSNDIARSIAIDVSGNVYTTGHFYGTADFDPGAGTFNLTSTGGGSDRDIFVSKLDVNGSFVWAKRMGGVEIDDSNGIAVDASGNVYTTGYFQSTADFDPGTDIFNLTTTATGYQNIFVSKLDANGNFGWAKSMNGGHNAGGNSIAVDGSGNVYTTGWFQGTIDFDPGVGTFNLTNAAGTFGVDIFVSKLDANGNFGWAKNMGGAYDYSYNNGFGIVVDGFGNVHITGFFEDIVDFETGTGISTIKSGFYRDIFVSKIVPCDAISIKPVARVLPSGNVGTIYSQTVSQTGLIGTPTWSIRVGTLPVGLVINPTSGVISGIPTTIGTFNFTIQVTNGSCIITKPYSIAIDSSLPNSFSANINNELTTYPNPTSGLLNLKLKNILMGNYEIKVTDMLGRMVLKSEIFVDQHTQEIQLDLQHLPDSVYLIHLIHSEWGKTIQIIKNK